MQVVYIELFCGKQSELAFDSKENTKEGITIMQNTSQSRTKCTFNPSEEEIAAHDEFPEEY